MNQFAQWNFLLSLEPGTRVLVKVYGRVEREIWMKLNDPDENGLNVLWTNLETGDVRNYSWLCDERFPPELVKEEKHDSK